MSLMGVNYGLMYKIWIGFTFQQIKLRINQN